MIDKTDAPDGYEAVASPNCKGCAFDNNATWCSHGVIPTGCDDINRADDTDVIFKLVTHNQANTTK